MRIPVCEDCNAAPWDARIRRTSIVIGRLGLACLFFSQLFWKLPPDFGCTRDGGAFVFTSVSADGQLLRTTGLCDWLGVESIFAKRERSILGVNFNNHDGGSEMLATPLAWLVRANGAFVDQIVIPYIGVFGWLVWLAEAFVVVSMTFGIFSRLGALVSLGLGVQLMLGLAGVSDAGAGLQEWEWSYHQIIILSILLLGVAPGRIVGIDGLLRPRFLAAAEQGNRLARLLAALG